MTLGLTKFHMIIDLRDKRERAHSVKKMIGHELGQQSGISLIMAFDEAAYPQLKSLLSTLIQSHVAEWIFLDVGTSPDIQDTLASIAEETNKVTLLKTEKMTQTEAWQLGADKAKGEYLLFLDAHFALTATTFSQVVESITHITRPGPWLGGFFVKEGERKTLPSMAIEDPKTALKNLLRFHAPVQIEGARNHPLEPMLVPALEPHALLIKRSDYWAIGGLDSRLTPWFAASDLALKIHCQGGQVYCFTDVYVLPVKRSFKQPLLPHIVSCVRYYQKHYRKNTPFGTRYSLYLVFSMRAFFARCARKVKQAMKTVRAMLKKSKKTAA